MSSPNTSLTSLNGKSKIKVNGKMLGKGKGNVKDGKSIKPGSNWQALKKTLPNSSSQKSRFSHSNPTSSSSLNSTSTSSHFHSKPSLPSSSSNLSSSKGKDKAQISTETSSTSSPIGSPAPTTLPWFFEDLSPEDLNLVKHEMGASTSSSTSKIGSSKDLKPSARNGVGQWLDFEYFQKMGMEDQWEKELERRMDFIRNGPAGSEASKEKKEPGQYLAIDCEMVGVGPLGSESVLARVSLTNFYGHVILDTFVKPQEKVTDYRTWVSGVRPQNLKSAPIFSTVQKQVAAIIKDKILIGHAIHNDLKALLLDHPNWLIRDTSKNKELRSKAKTKFPSLKNLAKLTLGIEVQADGEEHNSVMDARVTMEVYKTQMKEWEMEARRLGKGRINGKREKEKIKRKLQDGDDAALNGDANLEKKSSQINLNDSIPGGPERKRVKKQDQGEWWRDL